MVMLSTAPPAQQLPMLPSEASVFADAKVKEEQWLLDGSSALPGPHSDVKCLVPELLHHSLEPQRILPSEPVPCDAAFNGFVVAQSFSLHAPKQDKPAKLGGRRARDLNLPPQELERRQLRRQRNKVGIVFIS
jgi:hypothetical protein